MGKNAAAPRRRTERSESAAKRARKAPPPRRQPPHFHPAPPKLCAKQICAHSWHEERTAETPPAAPPLSAPGVHPAVPLFAHRFCVPPGAKRRAPAGAPFLKGHHKFALWNDTIALRLKNRVAPLFGGGAPKSVGGAKNGFVMRFFALQPFL